jgi:hypothetical protein
MELKFYLTVALIAASCYRQYSFYTIIEYGLFLALILVDPSSSFCACISVKVFVCLLFFLGDYLTEMLSVKIYSQSIFTCIIRTWRQLYRALIALGDDIFRYTRESGTGNNEQPQGVIHPCYWFAVLRYPTPCYGFCDEMFHSPCLGFAVPNIGMDIVQPRLEADGRYHDWAIAAIDVLSCHKFLSYSIVSFARKLTFIGCIYIGSLKMMETEFHLHAVLTQSYFSDSCDCFLISVTLLDTINSIDFKLDDSDQKVRRVFDRGIHMKVAKLVIICVLVASIRKSSYYGIISRYGYLFYIGVCMLCAAMVHLITYSWRQIFPNPTARPPNSSLGTRSGSGFPQ